MTLGAKPAAAESASNRHSVAQMLDPLARSQRAQEPRRRPVQGPGGWIQKATQEWDRRSSLARDNARCTRRSGRAGGSRGSCPSLGCCRAEASLRRLWRRRCRPLQGRRRRASPHRVAKRCPRPRLRVVRSLGGSQSPGLGLFDKGYVGLWLETTDKVRHRGHSLPLLHCHGCENFKIPFPRRGYGFLLSFHRAGVSFPSYHGSLFASFEKGEEENCCGCKSSQGQH